MKKIFMLFAVMATLVFVACRKATEENVELTVRVANAESLGGKGPHEDVSDVTEVNVLTLLFFKRSDYSLELSSNQMRGDANFGTFDISIPAGTYDMVILAYGGSTPVTVSSYTLATLDVPTNIFHTIQTVNISASSSSGQTINANLSRVSTRLALTATDTIPSNVDHLRFTFSGASGIQLNPSTGGAASNGGFSIQTGSLASIVGQSGKTFSINFPLYESVQTMTVDVYAIGSTGDTISSRSIPNVEFRRNRKSLLSGSLFHQSNTTGITINTDWIDDYDAGTF